MPKVSVIVPVYGVEKYIERCVRSLFAQTLDDIEYLFIDDCTPDRSVEILRRTLEEYPHRKEQVTIHRMERNSGQAKVREWGMRNATGEYVIHCDSDDWVDTDMYRAMYEKAYEERADVIVCDYYRTNAHKTKLECGCHSIEINEFIENCLFQKDPWSLWNKLFARSCYHNITYPFGDLGEDMMLCIQMLNNCRVMGYISRPFYYYYFNPDSITKKQTIDNCVRNYNQLKKNTEYTIKFINTNFEKSSIDGKLASKCLLLMNKFTLLNVKHLQEYKHLWKKDFPIMPLRFFLNRKICLYYKIVYVLATLSLYPNKRLRICK